MNDKTRWIPSWPDQAVSDVRPNRSIILSARGLSSRHLNDSATSTIRFFRTKIRVILKLNKLILIHHISVETLDDPIYYTSIPILYL